MILGELGGMCKRSHCARMLQLEEHGLCARASMCVHTIRCIRRRRRNGDDSRSRFCAACQAARTAKGPAASVVRINMRKFVCACMVGRHEDKVWAVRFAHTHAHAHAQRHIVGRKHGLVIARIGTRAGSAMR